MSHYYDPPDLLKTIQDLKARIQALENSGIALYTVATRPASGTGRQIIYVSDATAGQRYQGWDATGAAWVPLG